MSYNGVWPRIASAAQARGKGPDSVALSIALEIAAAQPGRILRDVARNLWAAWALPSLMTTGEARRVSERFQAIGPLPLQPGYPAVRSLSAIPIYAVRGLMLLTFLGSLVALLAGSRGMVTQRSTSREVVFAAALSAGLHAAFLLTALMTAAIPRYTLSMSPLMVLLVCCMAVIARDAISPG